MRRKHRGQDAGVKERVPSRGGGRPDGQGAEEKEELPKEMLRERQAQESCKKKITNDGRKGDLKKP